MESEDTPKETGAGSTDLVLPEEVRSVSCTLTGAGYEAYLVGGCVRDILLGKVPKDWDVATDATPKDILSVFPHAHYDNDYGTVRVVNDVTDNISLKVIEVTTYRKETGYSDSRRPDSVLFSTNLHDDLQRRDFTINSLALKISCENTIVFSHETLVDDFGGIKDLHNGVIRAVGSATERFNEDALRIMRAIRIATEHGFTIENETKEALKICAPKLSHIAIERIRDEFERIILSKSPMRGLEVMYETGVLPYTIPDLLDAIGVEQNQAHSFTVWEHLLRSLQATADKGWNLEVRLAALLHDISKPATKEWQKKKNDWGFYGHDVVGARTARAILTRLKFPKKIVDKVVVLVRWHMFFSDTEQITLSAVRRLIRNVGEENIWDLMRLRIADRIGTGRPKEDPYRLRKYKSMIEEALRDPVSVKMLAVHGGDLMSELQIAPGPRIGDMLHALLEEVLDDPKLNTREILLEKARELNKLSDQELALRGAGGKQKQSELEEKEIGSIRGKYWVK